MVELVRGNRHVGEACGDGLDMEVREMKASLVTPRFLASLVQCPSLRWITLEDNLVCQIVKQS